MGQFKGGYYFAILEIFEEKQNKNKEFHGKELFNLFEEKFGSGNYINFNKALKKLKKSGEIQSVKSKHYNRVYYSKAK